MKIFPYLQTYLKIFSTTFVLFISKLYSQKALLDLHKLTLVEIKKDGITLFVLSQRCFKLNWNHHWYCKYILIISAYIPTSILLSIYICIISKVGIVCPNSFHLTYVSWNKERSNHFICPITKALQTELKPSLILPIHFDYFCVHS